MDFAMKFTPVSPRIVQIAWGYMLIEGVGAGQDFKLWPGGGRTWDWRETGTHHQPGIQPADVNELVYHGATTIVLSRGMWPALQIRDDTAIHLERRGVTVRRAETYDAVRIYNELAERGIPVGGLFHSTC